MDEYGEKERVSEKKRGDNERQGHVKKGEGEGIKG